MGLKKKPGGFRPPRKVEEYWNLYKKGLYVEKPSRKLPAWFVPLLIFLLIITIVFWAAPMALSRLQIRVEDSSDHNNDVYIYEENVWTVNKPVADVFDRADLKAKRLTQVLYNEPVTVIDDENTVWGFRKVALTGGNTGFMLATDLMSSSDSIEPALAQYKTIVSSSSKRIMSHARSGTMLVEVMMGTTLFADYRGDGILRVRLPDGGYGWVSEDGLLVILPDQSIEINEDGARYYCNTAMSFHNVTVLDQGQSRDGVSVEGIARIAGIVNGIELPRTIEEQIHAGKDVSLAYINSQEKTDQDEENDESAGNNENQSAVNKTNGFDLSVLRPADLVFVDDAANPGIPVSMAIVMENGQFLMAKSGSTSIQLVDPVQIADWTNRIISVRRLF